MSSAFTDGEKEPFDQQGDEAGAQAGHGNTPNLSSNGVAGDPSKEENSGSGAIQVRFTGMTAVGLVREHNEDNLVNANLTSGKLYPRSEICSDVIGDRGSVFAVCDGMGGAAAGEVASQMAVDIIFNALRAGTVSGDRDELARMLVTSVEQAGRRIYETAQSDQSRRGMGTTVTAAVLLDKVLFLAQVGDSRAYLLRNGEVKQLTKDQSLVSQLIEAGHLTEAEAESFEHSNIILQALGTSQTVQVDLTFIELRKNDRLMLCSDGLSGMVDASALHQTLREHVEPKACCERLIEQANEGGGHDNITVIVVDFFGDGLQPAAPSDFFGYMQYPLPLAKVPSVAAPAPKPKAAAPKKTVKTERRPIVQESSKRSSHVWTIAGVTAIVAAAAAVVVVKPPSTFDSETPTVRHELKPAKEKFTRRDPENKTEETRPLEKTNRPVTVRIRTEVENARLSVNGEPRGPISAGETKIIELAPGAYRFEAHAGGSIAAAAVATVRPETPLEIALNLPSGAAASSEKKDPSKTSEVSVSAAPPRDTPSRKLLARKKASSSATSGRTERELPIDSPAVTPAAASTETLPAKTDTSAVGKKAADVPSSHVTTTKKADLKVDSAESKPPVQPSQPTVVQEKSSDIPDNPF
jgi:serine/threonine protein phosphatase PrpC